MKGKLGSTAILVAAALLFAMVFVISGQLTTTRSVIGKAPAAPLSDGLSPEQQLAQDLALSDSRVQAYTVGRRSEVFGVALVGSQYTEAANECATADCRLVQIYNWDENVAISVIVNIDSRQVLDVLRLPNGHPGINKRHVELAQTLVLNDPELPELLGFEPDLSHLAFPPMEGDAPGTSCDGFHLCVAYTFDQNDRMLWVWVDLTDETIAGYRWTTVNPGENFLYTDTSVSRGCVPSGTVTRDGWTMNHDVTNSDGLIIADLQFLGRPIATSIKLAEWHADYGTTGFRDSTGCNSPGGGGYAIYPYGNTTILDLMDEQNQVVGFEVVQDFRMPSWGNSCNYRYEQRIQFFPDGRFRTVSGAYGKGCGVTTIYRPLVRIDIAVDGDDNDTFAIWENSGWVDQATELWRTPYSGADGPHDLDPNGYAWRVMDQNGFGFYMQPSQNNTFGDGSRGDDNFIFTVRHKPAEGDADLPAFNDCCFDDHRQGPHQFVNGENISDTNIVLWYVPQMQTDATDGGNGYYCWTITGEPNPETYPCFTGPMFVPITNAEFSSPQVAVPDIPVQFTNESSGPFPLGYYWDFGDGVGNSTAFSPTYSYSSTGLYTVTLTVTSYLEQDVTTQTILVNSLSYQPFMIREP